MEDLLRVTDVVVAIAQNLNTQDYLHFQQLNKTIYHNHLGGANDARIWCRKLRAMGLTQRADGPADMGTFVPENTTTTALAPAQPEKGSPALNGYDAATIFDGIREFSPSSAKRVYAQFYRCFQTFTDKLYYNDLSRFFPEKYNDPTVQAKILSYLSRYHESNAGDWSYYRKAKENLQILREIFVNSVLQEMEHSFQDGNLAATAQFVQVLLLCHEENTAVDFFRSKNDFMNEVELPQTLFDGDTGELDPAALDGVVGTLRRFLNGKIEMADALFGDKYPVVVAYVETVIEDNIVEYFNGQLAQQPGEDTAAPRIESLPQVYRAITDGLVQQLNESRNAGPSFRKVVLEFFNLYLEPKMLIYLDVTLQQFDKTTQARFAAYQEETAVREREQNEQIYNSLRSKTDTQMLIDEKNNFLSSFTKIFKSANSGRSQAEEQLQLAYNLNTMNNSLQNFKSLISLDLCYNVVQLCKNRIEQMYTFAEVASVSEAVRSRCQQLFKALVFQLSTQHIRPGFNRAIGLLEQYNPNEIKTIELDLEGSDAHVEPLVKFTELINVGDIVLQMISIFYRNELERKGIVDRNRDFLNDVVQTKKNFETMLDDFVAEGLNIGINKLMDEVFFVFNTLQLPSDFNPDGRSASQREIRPSACAVKIVELLSNHCFLLTGATDKGTIDVFQQEVGERFFSEVVKNIKKNLISTDGAIFLICDLNYYYDFIANKLRQKAIVPLFAGLKSVGQIYLVSGKDSKELGKMICDVGKFQGIFTQEEVYEFVQRRTDWVRVRRDVEKVMYGLGVSDCCVM